MKKVIFLISTIVLVVILTNCKNLASKSTLKDFDNKDEKWVYQSSAKNKFIISFKDNIILGTDGCNGFNISYKTEEKNKISMRLEFTTKKACDMEYALTQSEFVSVTSYKITKSQIKFTTPKGKVLIFEKNSK